MTAWSLASSNLSEQHITRVIVLSELLRGDVAGERDIRDTATPRKILELRSTRPVAGENDLQVRGQRRDIDQHLELLRVPEQACVQDASRTMRDRRRRIEHPKQ